MGIYEEWVVSTSQMLVEIDETSMTYWRMLRPNFKVRVRHRWSDFKFTMVASFLRFCQLSRRADLWYPLYLFSLYITIGPWFLGDFVPSETLGPGKRWGWLMVYGICIKLFLTFIGFKDGSWEPVLDTWLYSW